MVGGLKNLKLLPEISFDSGFQEIVLSSLLLFVAFLLPLGIKGLTIVDPYSSIFQI